MNENLDSRELQTRIEELEEQQEDESLDEQEAEELKSLLELKEECEGYGWEYGIYFILDYKFRDYAEEFFDDCMLGDSPEAVRNYIDYDSFAKDLENDYTSVDFEGESFLYREA